MAINIKDNPSRRTSYIWLAVGLLGIFGIFAPFIFGMDGFNGGFALSFFSLFVAIAGITGFIIYLGLARAVDNALNGEGLLAHWKYAPGEWKEYTEKENVENAGAKKGLFLVLLVISILIGVGFLIFDMENGWVVLVVLAAVDAFICGIVYISIKADYRNNLKNPGEVYLTLNSVYLNRRIHLWKGIGTRLEAAELETEYRHQPRLKFVYSAIGRHSRNYYTARVPIPAGEEETAKRVLAEIRAAHKLKGEI
jgi:hypothetical protein